MAYDLYGTWSNPKKAENHAPLYRRSWDTQPLNANDVVELLLNLGASKDKIILGIIIQISMQLLKALVKFLKKCI